MKRAFSPLFKLDKLNLLGRLFGPLAFVLLLGSFFPVYAGPIHNAVKVGDLDELIILTHQAGFDVDEQDELGFTVLHWAADLNKLDFFFLLLHENPDLSIKNDQGQIPLELFPLKNRRFLEGFLYGSKVKDGFRQMTPTFEVTARVQSGARLILGCGHKTLRNFEVDPFHADVCVDINNRTSPDVVADVRHLDRVPCLRNAFKFVYSERCCGVTHSIITFDHQSPSGGTQPSKQLKTARALSSCICPSGYLLVRLCCWNVCEADPPPYRLNEEFDAEMKNQGMERVTDLEVIHSVFREADISVDPGETKSLILYQQLS